MRHSVVESEKRLARRLNGGQGQRGSAILYGMNNLAEREPQIAFRSVEPRVARPELPPFRQSRCYCSRASLINLMTTSVHVCTHLLANGDFVTALVFALDRTGGESLSNLAPGDNGQQEDRQRDDETSCLRVQGLMPYCFFMRLAFTLCNTVAKTGEIMC